MLLIKTSLQFDIKELETYSKAMQGTHITK